MKDNFGKLNKLSGKHINLLIIKINIERLSKFKGRVNIQLMDEMHLYSQSRLVKYDKPHLFKLVPKYSMRIFKKAFFQKHSN